MNFLLHMAPSAISPPKLSAEPEETLDNTILPLRKTLTSESAPLAHRFRALFSLKHHASQQPPTTLTLPAIAAIAAAFASPSALLKHELAYCLGQTRHLEAVPYLRKVLKNKGEDPMCRHEAAEALGALGDTGSLEMLKGLRDDAQEAEVVRETCEIAVERIDWEHSTRRKTEVLRERCVSFTSKMKSLQKPQTDISLSDFASVDPAPPLPLTADLYSIPELQERLLNTSLPLFDRYRAMFALRDLASPPDLNTAIPAVKALATGFSDSSALFRHEVAFVFGQLSHPASIPSLKFTLSNKNEESMVRHEAAEALGSLGDEDGVEEFLRGFLDDSEQVVRESVVVALDMADFEKNGEREYAILLEEDDFSPLAKLKS